MDVRQKREGLEAVPQVDVKVADNAVQTIQGPPAPRRLSRTASKCKEMEGVAHSGALYPSSGVRPHPQAFCMNIGQAICLLRDKRHPQKRQK
jgi:hypothetical protein